MFTHFTLPQDFPHVMVYSSFESEEIRSAKFNILAPEFYITILAHLYVKYE
jgi:hypothetical protein